jgi:hypothetical protein
MKNTATLLVLICLILPTIQGCCQTPKRSANYYYNEPDVYNDSIVVDNLSQSKNLILLFIASMTLALKMKRSIMATHVP